MKNHRILALSLCLILVLGLSFAMAIGNKSGNSNLTNKPDKSVNKDIKRANYGLCVSAQTRVRDSCYKAEKEKYKGCEAERRRQFKEINFTDPNVNKTQVKEQLREKSRTCRENYKNGLNQCRLSFQASKGNCEIQKPHALNSTTCTGGGGRWNECGSRCAINNQGKEDVACTTVCEALCECGTIAGLTCPTGYTCRMPAGVADAMGYCK